MNHLPQRIRSPAAAFGRACFFGGVLACVLGGVSARGVPAPLLIPQPKSVHCAPGNFVFSRAAVWRLRATVLDERLWQTAQRVLASTNGRFEKISGPGVNLQIGADSQTLLPTAEPRPEWAVNAEGYRIVTTPTNLLLLAATAQGTAYGLQTIAQLVQPDGTNFATPLVEIEDWPSLRFRGVHWFPSASGAAMDHRLIENVFAAFKFNACVIQCEAARWDSHPEIAASNSISKTDLRELVDLCRSRFVEPIPLINVPGHADWLFRNHQHLDLAEDPVTPYAVCVNNPEARRIIEDVMTECIELFHPQTFHIGHDEITMRGRFPNPDCPRCRAQTAASLMTQNANRLADWLAAQGIATMMWGDMLLGPEEAADATSAPTVAEAKTRRAALSRKITIADWHYAWNADARSLQALEREGFHTLAATWSEPVNIFRFSKAAIAAGADGLLQTTWAGFFPDERALRAQVAQFAAYVIAADYAWSGRTNPPAELGYDAREIFQRAYAGELHLSPKALNP